MLTLADFTGCLWHISRPIEDRRAGTAGEFRGSATLWPHGDGLLYREMGRLQLAEGPILQAERNYLWLQAGERIEVRFEDGRSFHSFRPEGRAAGTDHPCGRDLYRVTYDFTAWPEWSSEWIVVGPAKDYVMTSRYKRVPRDSSASTGAPTHFHVRRIGQASWRLRATPGCAKTPR